MLPNSVFVCYGSPTIFHFQKEHFRKTAASDKGMNGELLIAAESQLTYYHSNITFQKYHKLYVPVQSNS